MFSVLKKNENGFDIVELKDESTGTTASVIPSYGAILHAFTVLRDGSSLNVIDSSFEDLKNMHARLGWKLLMNEHVSIPVNEANFNVIGVENYSANPRFHKYGDLSVAKKDMPGGHFNVLLSHDPSHWHAQVTNDHPDIHLTLSGHTHGFQFGVEIPGFFKWSPIQYMYPQWAGLYENMGQYLYVNRGLGYLGYPGRVGILPEITLITLETT